MKSKTIFEKHDCCYFIKEIEEYLKHLSNKKTEWLSKSTDLEKQKSTQEYKNIKKWFSNVFSNMSSLKKQYKEEASINSKLIRLASERYKKENGKYYGKNFEFRCLNSYLTPVEQSKYKSEKFKLWNSEKINFIHKYIAWSLLNGKTFKQILQNCRKDICFKDIEKNINLFFHILYPENDKKLYILLAKQFDKKTNIEQSGKTIIKWVLENKGIDVDVKNMNIFYLDACDSNCLEKIKNTLKHSEIKFTEFTEENDKLVSIAAFCNGELFQNLKEFDF